MDKLYMLDTNTASYIIKGVSQVKERLCSVAMASVSISAITEAELLRGVARKPEAKHLANLVKEFLLRVNILPWNSDAAEAYAKLRTSCEKDGFSLGTMDMLIASHSVAVKATLITNDKAFYNVERLLSLEDWTRPLEH
ncbi:type II toxin-antitoxin system VapC family toxin [Endozoicomonas sp. SM1973]|uniref:Type II toxin-antitoxin system VapC family toxin n=1 Tax=Spartinivicinus marinus TaxID=2994442 RepID=A0A853I176_9GAMM|nr:type II toxin-antitoxin system VapC family toxin [Spartinivicinus marinus]MCX4025609.1 type II toxin-antitoxin system VapC family toxin [Spartinivicinus marinus]NYZ65162.1 type II toxin-antitoxin system VapC family toxin [Spartinivicinus marinus]